MASPEELAQLRGLCEAGKITSDLVRGKDSIGRLTTALCDAGLDVLCGDPGVQAILNEFFPRVPATSTSISKAKGSLRTPRKQKSSSKGHSSNRASEQSPALFDDDSFATPPPRYTSEVPDSITEDVSGHQTWSKGLEDTQAANEERIRLLEDTKKTNELKLLDQAERIKELEKHVECLQAEKDGLSKSLEEARKSHNETTKSAGDMKSELEKLRVENFQMFTTIQYQHANFANRIAEMLADAERMAEALTTLERDHQRVREDNVLLTEERRIHGTVSKLVQRIRQARLQRQLDDEKRKCADLEDRLTKESATLRSELAKKAELEARIARLSRSRVRGGRLQAETSRSNVLPNRLRPRREPVSYASFF